MKIKISAPIFILLMVLAAACQKQTTDKEDNSEPAITDRSADSLTYIFKDFTKKYGDCQTDTSAYCTRVQLNYPEFDTTYLPSVSMAINEQIESHVLNQFFPDTVENKSIDMFVEGFINDYKEVKEAFGEAFGWYAEINGKVLRNDSAVVTVELDADIYTGGAHGSFNRQYLNFNTKSGNTITLGSLFRPGYEQYLNETVEKTFRQAYKIQPDTDLSDEGYEFENGQYYNNNFALLPDGIKFYYNSYEIAPYAKGPSEVFVSYGDLTDILKLSVISPMV